jgi:hypothetical protein
LTRRPQIRPSAVGVVVSSRFGANCYETALAVGAVAAFLLYVHLAVFAVDQAGSAGSVVQAFPVVTRWMCFGSFGLGGALVLWGLGRPRLAAEIAGLLILTGGLGIYIVAVLVFLGPRYAATGGPLLVAFQVANVVRIRSLVANRDVIAITDGEEEIRLDRHGH